MEEFTYHRPAALADAVAGLRARPDARLIAGGQSLLGAMKLGLAAPTDLVDLAAIASLRGITETAEQLRVGAMTSHAAVAAASVVRRRIPALARLADWIGDPAVRARGTLGGSLANSDPAACYPAGVLGLGARIETDRRSIDADAFFTGLYETALARDEIITAVHFPVPRRAAWQKFRQPASRFSLVGVFVSDGVAGPRVAVTGAGACAFRVPAFERALASNWSPRALEGLAIGADGLNTDLHATAAFRAHLVGVLAQRAVAETLEAATLPGTTGT
jgi:carbon-monoxide dehydrogenase medium subunit